MMLVPKNFPKGMAKKELQACSSLNSMLIVFLDIQDIVHKEFILPGETVIGKFYLEVLKLLMESLQC